MHFQSLDGKWDFRQLPGEEWLPAQVPGSVHLDLLSLGRIPDPFVGDNEKKVQWVAEKDWEYRRVFIVDAELLKEDKLFLLCEGLDTLAEVYLNGQPVGNTNNYFRPYEWEIGRLVNPRTNEITVRFCSPVRYITQKQEELLMRGSLEAIDGYPHLRKPAAHFGWDWGPKLPPVGIWKAIRLEGRSSGRISHVHVRQAHADQKVKVSLELSAENWRGTSQTAKVTVHGPDDRVYAANQEISAARQTLEIEIDHPKLWWPNGYGDHPLYQLEIVLESQGVEIDRITREIGLRKLELVQEKDTWGRSFQFKINDLPIFAKGSNWIPADSFPTRVSDSRLEILIQSAVATHQNMLRVWGGGYYETEQFYTACDRNGILIWQDFMFACGIYPFADPAFIENIREEVILTIERLHTHPCLAIWCGNNEMEWGWNSWGWDLPGLAAQKQAYDGFFHHTLPALCAEEDPDTPYWPSSPSSNVPFNNPNGEYQGDTHFWDVWHGRKPFSAYKDSYPRFMSEFGFQSLPPLKTIQTYADPGEWNMTSYVMEHHQRSRSGNGLMISQMAEHFRMPKDFDSMVYLSMVLQAEGIRFGVEHWRRNKNRVSGVIYWQLNDIWPVASWSSIDYFGRWKALHYAARRFYAPVMISVDQDGTQLSVHVTSDLAQPWDGSLHWSMQTTQGIVLESGEAPVLLNPFETRQIMLSDFSNSYTPENERELFYSVRLEKNGDWVGQSLVTYVKDKHLILSVPMFTTLLEQAGSSVSLKIETDCLARFVEISLAGADPIFSDNYFDLIPNEPRTITFPLPEGWSIQQVQKDLRIRSLADSY